MKLLPCRPTGTSGRPGCGTYALLPDGKPYVMGRTPEALHGKGGYIYRCFRCKLNSQMDAAQWHRIPELTLADLRRLGLEEMVTKDLQVTFEQAAQLEAYGIDFAHLHRDAQAFPAAEGIDN